MKSICFAVLFVGVLLQLVRIDGAAVLHAPKGEHAKNKYIVVLDDRVTVEQQLEHVSKIFKNLVDKPLKIEKTLNIGNHFKAYLAIMNNATLERVLQLPHVQYVVPEEILRFTTLDKKNETEGLHSSFHRRKRGPCTTQSNADWGLERTSVRRFHNTRKYTYSKNYQGQGVDVYVIDTGVYTSHEDFEGRARLYKSYVHVRKPDEASHGTLVASLIIGKKYGVAKKARVAVVRVLDGDGEASIQNLVESIQYVASQARHKRSTVILNFSIGVPSNDRINDAARAAVRDGVVFVTAAGNEGDDACKTSPANVAETITVGGSDRNDMFMRARKAQSNYGACVDIFAPSEDILGAGTTNPSSTQTETGTCFGTALVSGILAKLLSENPRQTPFQLKQRLLRNASRGELKPPMGRPWPPSTANLLVHEGCS